MHNLTGWIWRILSAHAACAMKKGKSPKVTSCGLFNFEGDGLKFTPVHIVRVLSFLFFSEGDGLLLNLLKKTQIFGSSSFFIHITYYGKVANFLIFVA